MRKFMNECTYNELLATNHFNIQNYFFDDWADLYRKSLNSVFTYQLFPCHLDLWQWLILYVK